jgi:hypothetical protein
MPLRAIATFVFFLLLGVSALRGIATAGTPRAGQTWLVVSDIHLDPYLRGPNKALFGSDTNLALFRSALAAMKRAAPDPALVLLPGDFFAHDFGRRVSRNARARSAGEEGLRTVRLIAAAFGDAFPRARFAIALGNNDAPCGDYRTAFDTAYMAAVARAWAPLVDRGGDAPDFKTSFARDGHYAMSLRLRGMRLVAIDDVPLAVLYAGNCGPRRINGAESELRWLQTALSAAPPDVRNIVMMHAPPGYDVMTTERTRGLVPWPFLEASVNARLLSVLSAPANRVAYAIAGHAHRFDFRIDGDVPILVFGALSPIYHNNPTFYTLEVREDGSVRDIGYYAFDEWTQTWQPPRSFDAKWGVATIDAASLASVHVRLEQQPKMRRAWDAASSGWPSNRGLVWGMWEASWRIPWCAQTSLSGGFTWCAGLVARVWLFRMTVALAVLGAGALAIILARLIKRALRRRRPLSS